MELDMKKLEPLLGTMVNELGAAANAALVLIGDKLGLYKRLAEFGPPLRRWTCRGDRYAPALHQGMVVGTGPIGIRRLRCRARSLFHVAGASRSSRC